MSARRAKIQRGLARLTDAGPGSRPPDGHLARMLERHARADARRAADELIWLGRALERAEEWTREDPRLEQPSTRTQWAHVGRLAGHYMRLVLGDEPGAPRELRT